MSNQDEKIIELDNYKSVYKGEEVSWFIGDLSYTRAVELGFGNDGKVSNIYNTPDGFYWQAWGRFKGIPYQLFAWCSRDGDVYRIKEITPIKHAPTNPYFNAENYKLLTDE